MVTTLLALNFLLMVLMPIFLGRWIAVRRHVGWGLFGIGAVAFVLSQVGHLPFNWLILQQLGWFSPTNLPLYALFLGLSAGTFEGVARYLTFRFWARDARSWRQGLMVGAGHGGIEAILLGVLGLINFVILLGLKNGYFQGILASVPQDQLHLVEQQIEAMFGVSPWMALFGALERVFALMLHLAASLLVMQALVRGQCRWLLAAIGWHALIDGTLVYVVSQWGIVWAETVLGGMSLVSLAIIFLLRMPEPTAVPLEPLPELKSIQPAPLASTAEMLERSKYSG
ncbi:MAG: YhfC family intramembrane metalloprotease [Anaerolineaceae bacterium]|nr:YhfC family intramembrane metalloprotease [Anaerolineaceae bacterium]